MAGSWFATLLVLTTILLKQCGALRDPQRPLLATGSFTPDSGDLLIRCGRLIDGRTDEVLEDVWVLIYGGLFKKIEKDLYARRGTPVFDLRSHTCLPWPKEMLSSIKESLDSGAESRVGEQRPAAEFIESGLFGDLVAMKGAPLEEIFLPEQIEAVVKGGLVFKAPQGTTR